MKKPSRDLSHRRNTSFKQLHDTSWKLGKIETTQTVDISFIGTAVFDVLTELAKSTECEWYLNYHAKTLNLVKRYEKGIVIELEREKNLTDVKRTNDDKEDNAHACICAVLHVIFPAITGRPKKESLSMLVCRNVCVYQ